MIFVPSEHKRDLLTALLDDPSFERVLVFTRTKHGADRVTRHLVGAGIDAAAIHGNKSQPQRERALAGFRSGKGRVLVATDIAARGIDVEAYRMSSISSCRMFPRTTCIASAEPRVPAPPERPSHSAAMRSGRICAISKNSPGSPFL